MNRKDRRAKAARERRGDAFSEGLKAGQEAAKSGKMPEPYIEAIEDAARRLSKWVEAQPSPPDLRWKEQKNDGVFLAAALPDVIDWIADSPDAKRMLRAVDEQTGHQLSLNQTVWALRLCRAIPMPDGSYYGLEETMTSPAMRHIAAYAHGTGEHINAGSPCPHCGEVLERTSHAEGHAPRPGDLSVCVKCLGICRFGDDLRLFAPTEDELDECGVRDQLEEMVALMRQAKLGVRTRAKETEA